MAALLFAAAGVLGFTGCSVSEESSGDVGRTFDEGIHGQGHLVPVERPVDESNGRKTP